MVISIKRGHKIKNHFDKNLNLKDIILERKPKLIVECGAASGENTRQILALKSIYPFKLVSISDAPYAEETMKCVEFLKDGYEWRYDLSYRALQNFEPESIDLCMIDTDHNYWTMKQELQALHSKLSKDGLIAMHDTETYWANSGQAYRYGTGDSYPSEEISKHEKEGKGMGTAILEFLAEHPEYKILKKVTESHGAMVMEKTNA